MTSGEIEDVLSSIRRLVSDGNRPMFRAAPRPFAREAEKLILTPALRVPPTGAGDAPARFALTERIEPPQDRPRLGSVVTAIAAAVPPPVHGWEPEAGDPVGPFAPELGSEGWDDAPAAPHADIADEDDDGWHIEEAPVALFPATPAAVPVSEAPLPAGDASDPVAEIRPIDAPADDAADMTAEHAHPAEDWPTAGTVPDSEVLDGWQADLAQADFAQPDVSQADLSHTDFAQTDDIPAETSVPFGPLPPLTLSAADAQPAAGPLIDDVMLTALIRDILREELRGPLGERITSNVRKLVRAEIARALALHAED